MTVKAIQPLTGERQKSESDNAVLACNDYLRMGAARSLSDLAAKYNDPQRSATENPPTASLSTLGKWSTQFSWQERAALYDAEIERQKDEQAKENMQKYLALDYWRVQKLKELADFLEKQLYEQGADGDYHNIWMPDVKQIGSGEHAEKVDIEKFNAPLISEFRATLDDIAKETGGRVKKTEVSGKDGGAIQVAFPKFVRAVAPDDSGSSSE